MRKYLYDFWLGEDSLYMTQGTNHKNRLINQAQVALKLKTLFLKNNVKRS